MFIQKYDVFIGYLMAGTVNVDQENNYQVNSTEGTAIELYNYLCNNGVHAYCFAANKDTEGVFGTTYKKAARSRCFLLVADETIKYKIKGYWFDNANKAQVWGDSGLYKEIKGFISSKKKKKIIDVFKYYCLGDLKSDEADAMELYSEKLDSGKYSFSNLQINHIVEKDKGRDKAFSAICKWVIEERKRSIINSIVAASVIILCLACLSLALGLNSSFSSGKHADTSSYSNTVIDGTQSPEITTGYNPAATEESIQTTSAVTEETSNALNGSTRGEEATSNPTEVTSNEKQIGGTDVTSNKQDETTAPVVTQDRTNVPETTKVPEVTTKPAETTKKAVVTTKTPITTKSPATTQIPSTTRSPETTKAPIVTTSPETTKSPDITIKPETTKEPEVTTAPIVIKSVVSFDVDYGGYSYNIPARTVTKGESYNFSDLLPIPNHKDLQIQYQGKTIPNAGIWQYDQAQVMLDVNFVDHLYTITFDPDGGECDTTELKLAYGELLIFPTATKKGQVIEGWTSGYELYKASEENHYVEPIFNNFGEDKTFTVSWVNLQYKIVYAIDNTIIYQESEILHWWGDIAYLYYLADYGSFPSQELLPYGQKIVGWKNEVGDTFDLGEGITEPDVLSFNPLAYDVSENKGYYYLVLYADIVPITYTISFADTNIPDMFCTFGEQYYIPAIPQEYSQMYNKWHCDELWLDFNVAEPIDGDFLKNSSALLEKHEDITITFRMVE